MSEIILVRHGQAMTHATDEQGYDRLSDLGRLQARWLGEHLRATHARFDAVITGTLTRQADTARAMGLEITARDPRLNELSYFALAAAAEAQAGIPAPRNAAEFAAHLPQVIAHWADNRLSGLPETYDTFAERVRAVIDETCRHGGRTLIVTSGGVIGMAMRHALDLGGAGMAKLMLQVMNSSLSRLQHVHGTLMVGTFNATPHLDTPERAHARTFI